MLFSSITFIFIFLPTVLAVYYILPMRAKNLWLLAASLFFYFYGEPKYLILMLAVIASSYVFGLITERAKGKARKAREDTHLIFHDRSNAPKAFAFGALFRMWSYYISFFRNLFT